jgi:hypothetical protein
MLTDLFYDGLLFVINAQIVGHKWPV